MSLPERTAPTTAASGVPGPQDWTDTDLAALVASDVWLRTQAPPDLIARHQGMHVAVVGEQILDGDPDFEALGKRLEARGATSPGFGYCFDTSQPKKKWCGSVTDSGGRMWSAS